MFSKIRALHKISPLDDLLANVKSKLAYSPVNTSSVAHSAIALEAISDHAFQELNSAYESLSLSLEGIAASLGNIDFSAQQRDAAACAGILAGDTRGAVTRKYVPLAETTNNIVVMSRGDSDTVPSYMPAMEAYDETDNRDAAAYSIVYNMQASTQDEFCEAFFPTIINSPDQVGFTITIRIMNVYDDFLRNISGALDNYRKQNIIRAYTDPTILKSEMTRIIPVYRTESAAMFTDPAVIAPRVINLDGEDINTSSLLPGKRINLIGISQTDTLLSSGLMDTTDSIDPGILLRYLYIKVGADVYQINAGNLPLSYFNYTPQDNYRVMVLNFDTTSILIDKNTLQFNGSAPVALTKVVTNDYRLRLSVNVTGRINIERGDTMINSSPVEIANILSASGDQLTIDPAVATGDLLTIIQAFNGAEVVGYELQAYRTNLNRRQRGQLTETTYFSQSYNIPLRSPITAIHPVTTNGQTDTSDLAALITVTRIRAINAGVGALISASQALSEYMDVRDTTNQGPDILGIGRLLVRPTYFSETIDILTQVDSLRSWERAADIQSAIVNKIRDYTYRMYRDSEYKAAADTLAGGIAPKPTILIGTDPLIYQYLMVTGDLRTLGEGFNVKIVSSLNINVRGHVFITFCNETAANSGTPDPLSFGNFAYAPELTIVVPMSRNGQISKELAVSPRYLHVVHLPILTDLIFTNIPNVVGKVTINNHPIV